MLDIWHINLNQDPELLPPVLDQKELTRESRFHFDHHRRQFKVSHIATRLILSFYSTIDPAKLIFKQNDFGKPFLLNEEQLLFNLSHSNEMAICAVSDGEELGVDIEQNRPLNYLEMAERFFSSIEFNIFSSLSSCQQQEAFFSCWTRKEAYIKAKGLGLSIPLEQFAVSLAPGLPASLLSSDYSEEDVGRFSLFDLKVAEGYTAALATAGLQKEEPVHYQWSL